MRTGLCPKRGGFGCVLRLTGVVTFNPQIRKLRLRGCTDFPKVTHLLKGRMSPALPDPKPAARLLCPLLQARGRPGSRRHLELG